MLWYKCNTLLILGHEKYSTDVQGFIPLKEGGGCLITSSPICTAVKIIDLDWYLHGHHTYYISIKVTNTAGLTAIQASSTYIHDVQLPAEGFVLDIDSQVQNSQWEVYYCKKNVTNR